MHAFIGDWARQPHLSVEHRSSMHGLNRRFLDLAGKGVLAPGLGARRAAVAAAAGRGRKLSVRLVRPALRRRCALERALAGRLPLGGRG